MKTKRQTKTRTLNKHNIIALGCWVFGGDHWGEQSDADSIDAMKTAWELGLTHWDTALGYGSGHSETLCVKFLKGKWDQVFLATKGHPGRKPESIIKSLNKSLSNLSTDYIDLYYFHWPRSDVDMRPHMELLEKEREKGTIGAIGVSNFSLEQMKQLNEVGKIDAHQLCYNLYWRAAEECLIPYCVNNDIAVVTYSSIAQGILTGKFPFRPVFKTGDFRPNTVFFQSDVWPHLFAATEKLKTITAEMNSPLQHLALQWVVQQSDITSVIVGARNGRQVNENAHALDRACPSEVMKKITDISNHVKSCLPYENNIFKYNP